MILRRSSLLVPGSNDLVMIAAIAVSVFVFAYSTHFGPIAILLYYALWFPLAALAPNEMLRGALAAWLPVTLVLLAVVSVVWSAAPATTLRAAVQLGTHAVCAIAAARFASHRAAVRGLALGGAIVLVYSIAFGRSSYDVLDGTYTFVGAFKSKNQLGFFASLCVLASLLIAIEPARTASTRGLPGWLWKAAWLGLALAATAVLLASASATALLALLGAAAALGAALVTIRVAPFARLILVAFGVVVALGLGTVAIQAGAIEAVLGAFGKDATLTGRTYLWSEGLAAAREAPVIGIGYQAYWVQGFSEAERLWEEFHIAARSGFHFHNTFVETLVELGAVGTFVVVALFASVLLRAVGALLAPRPGPPALLVFSLVVMLLVRSFSEVDVLTPFVVGSFLLFWAAGWTRMPAFAPDRASRAHAAMPPAAMPPATPSPSPATPSPSSGARAA